MDGGLRRDGGERRRLRRPRDARRGLVALADPLSAEDVDAPTSRERGEVRARPERHRRRLDGAGQEGRVGLAGASREVAWRPGSDPTMWSSRPAFSGLPGYEDTDLETEMDALERAAAAGPSSERELFRR